MSKYGYDKDGNKFVLFDNAEDEYKFYDRQESEVVKGLFTF